MVIVNAPSNLAATSEVAAGAAQFLTPVVIDLEALVVNGKQAHWHVRGGSFIGIHELLDSVVDHAQDFADTAAERVIALGLPLDSRVATVAAKATLPTLADGFQSWRTRWRPSSVRSTRPWSPFGLPSPVSTTSTCPARMSPSRSSAG